MNRTPRGGRGRSKYVIESDSEEEDLDEKKPTKYFKSREREREEKKKKGEFTLNKMDCTSTKKYCTLMFLSIIK